MVAKKTKRNTVRKGTVPSSKPPKTSPITGTNRRRRTTTNTTGGGSSSGGGASGDFSKRKKRS